MSTLSRVIENESMKKILKEFNRLGDKCYLENAGAALYPETLIRKVTEDLLNNIYKNPHSDKYSRECIDQVRFETLKYFNTDSSTYSVIFTSGATQSMKLILESFQFESPDETNSGSFVYLRDNHTSVLGLREIAKNKNVDVTHISHEDFLNSLTTCTNNNNVNRNNCNKGNTLLVYPAQSNFNGYKYPIKCIDDIKNGCLNSYLKKQLCEVNCKWYILLDAATYLSTNHLDLSCTQPDFLCLSFYKMFGYPTGLGALLIKNSSIDVLTQKSYFGGGTVDVVLSSEDFHVKREEICERFEDGTIPFLSVNALKHCFNVMNNLIPKVVNNSVIDTISYHTYYLAKDLYEQLLNLKHPNGKKAVVLYTDTDYSDIEKQGGIVTFNIVREDGTYIGYAEFQHMADLFNIDIRTGCFCNSGSCQRHLKITNKEVKETYKAGHKCGDEMDLVNGKPTGAIRVSFGYQNTFVDVDRLVSMICHCFVKTKLVTPKRTLVDFKNGAPQNILHNENKLAIHKNKYHSKDEIINKFTTNESKVILSEIAVFPIKSCGAFKVDSWRVGQKGFEYDREWMIVKDNGVCLTQKQNTLMCMIRPVIDLKNNCLTINFKGKNPITIPLDIPVDYKYKQSLLCQSKVCSDAIKGYDCGDEVADWISEALGISYLRLIRQSNEHKRIRKNKSNENQTMLSLSNQAQFLLVNKATVRWLKSKIEDPSFTDTIVALTDRFRGNLVVDMDQELAEREWQKVVIGDLEFKVESQCSRCQMVCIDQATGEKTVEPLRTISEQFAGKLRFGIYLSYIGTINGTTDSSLKTRSEVKPTINYN